MNNKNLKTLISWKYLRLFIIVVAILGLAWSVQFALASQPAQSITVVAPIHPDILLLDAQGGNVLDSGLPVSTMNTCGSCHDTTFIEEHSFHAQVGLNQYGQATTGRVWDSSNGLFGKWSPITYRYLSQATDAVLDLGTPEWLQVFGSRHAGGGPAVMSRQGIPLVNLPADPANPETSVLDPVTGQAKAWDWKQSGIVEMNCFLCHTEQPDNDARVSMLAAGAFGWANTATLSNTGVVKQSGDTWIYQAEAFTSEGKVSPSTLGIQDPSNQNCGLCHGVVHTNLDEPLTDSGAAAWRTSTTGQIISPQRISDSGLNVADKKSLSRSWDVHAERVVKCTECHFSLNNPVYETLPKTSPSHLVYDPRRIEIGAYLQKPLHQFARGESAQSTVSPEFQDTMRRCDSCHASEIAHPWLPYTKKHMEVVACETCHIPTMYAPAYQQVDWTVLTPERNPKIIYRGVEDPNAAFPYITGYTPVLLPKTNQAGTAQVAPYNLVTTWYWVYGEGDQTRPVREYDLEAVYFQGQAYAPEILAAFDQDGNGMLDDQELRIDSEAKQTLVAGRLAGLGLENPRIQGEVQPFSINHNVTGGKWATRDCASCHGKESRTTQPITLASYLPGGVLPSTSTTSNVSLVGEVVKSSDGTLAFQPDLSEQGLYVLGHSSVGWVDWFGIFAFLGVLAGVFTHGGLRYFAAKRAARHAPALKEVYMYTVYERFWHWLQTGTIILLLLTGLVIHKPDIFGMFSFAYIVVVHNVLAAILLINAALSLFYHLVSGEIKQYIPRPYGFFDQAIVQAKYYIEGIFKGSPHPFEKTPDRKLNPLQQITYFGILNVLLPLQVVTGALMWGAQHFPDISQALGGLPFLGPFHSLVAWLFASFIVAHVYLTTTGPYPLAGIKAMMLGWDEVEVEHHANDDEQGTAPTETTDEPLAV